MNKRTAQVAAWHIVTALCLPVVVVCTGLAVVFASLAHASDAIVDLMTKIRDRVIPYPDPTPEQAARLEAEADKDL